jgi:phosphatidylglycerol lysyltransferase
MGAVGKLLGAILQVNWRRLGTVLGLVLFVAAAFVVYQALESVTWQQLIAAISQVATTSLLGAGLATAVSYTALIGYDVLALRQIGARVPISTAATASFIGQAFTFTIGFGLLTGSAVRLRLYSAAGLSALDIVAVGFLCAITFWFGIAALTGISLVLEPSLVSLIDTAPALLNRILGALIVGGLAGYIVWVTTRQKQFRLGQWGFTLPGPRESLAAIVLGTLDTVAAAIALWLLLPASHGDLSFASFLVVFILATVLGVMSHVPGGVGVFETTIVLALPQLPITELVASFVLFRFIYYLIPFILALLLLALRELVGHERPIAITAGRVGGSLRSLFPRASALVVFAGGTVLLLSGATPIEMDRLQLLRYAVPLPFVEASHLAGSVVGLLLLVLASGLVRRLSTAWQSAVVLLLAGAIFSLVKGFDYEEALVCLGGLGLLVIGRHEFYRNSDFLVDQLSVEWLAAILIAIVASIWLGFFVYRYVDYSPDLWWHFAYRADAPRFLRASITVAVTALAVVTFTFIHRPPSARLEVSPEMWDRARRIIKASPHVDAHLGLIGDKQFLISERGDGLIMYGLQHRSLVAMGDPVAQDEDTVEDLVWSFKERADKLGATPVFYQASTEFLPVYVDAGFSLLKLGEEAWVDLSRFTLEGGKGRKLRQAKARAEKAGATFEIVRAPEVEAILEELREVSCLWLGKKGKEKGFSLGFWKDEYMLSCDQGVVRHNGHVAAFANIWRSAQQSEVTVDLMRQRPGIPGGAMDLLFLGLLTHAQQDGYRWFSLGMAPLSGLRQHRLAPRWSKLGALIYHGGERFYHFEGLRTFKEKFRPEWRPRYLAYPGGLSLPQILFDVTTLIATSPEKATHEIQADRNDH